LDQLTPVFERPLVISQVDFAQKKTVQDHVLMLGDAAGLIHPLAGNGMAMALRSAALLAPVAAQFLRGDSTRRELESRHTQIWHREFGTRRHVSWGLQSVFESATLSDAMCGAANAMPAVARLVIRSTHGSTF
jgi:2-polyprenyl-6-methoxyphenol hydroxylase-like FAD-dependent oxidoreductase